MNDRVSLNIIDTIGIVAQLENGWTREINIVSWNGGPAKIDIREWSADHAKMTRGITLTDEEARTVYELLKARYE